MASFRKVGRNWFFRFIDADGVQRERRGCPDRRATEEMARAAESGGVWFWLRSFVILASEGVISTSSLFRNPYDQGGSACTPSSTSVARMPNAPMRASEAGETSPSVAGAARDTASAWPPAAPARPASPNARGPSWSRRDCPTRRPSMSGIPSARVAGRGPPDAWWAWTRTPSHATSPWPAPMPSLSTKNWWPFPPTTREVQLDEKWAFVSQSLSGKLRCLISCILEWDRLPCLVGRQSPGHPADGTDLDPGLTRLRAPLIVLAMTPISAQPGEAPFRHPTLRQSHVADRALGALHDLDRERLPCSLQPRCEGVIPVLPIAPDGGQPGEPRPVQLPEHLRRRRSVVGRGRRDHHRQQPPQRIEGDMSLPPVDLLARIIASLPTTLGALDRLAVDIRDPRRRLASLGHAQLLPQGVGDPLPGAIVAPLGEGVVDGALGQQVVRQQLPLAAGAGLVQQGIEDLPYVDLAGPTAGQGGGDQGLDDLPLGVGQVGLVGLTHRGIGRCAKGWTPVPTRILGPNRLSG